MSLYLGVDPGTKLCGWALVDMNTKTIISKGHDDLNTLRDIINLNQVQLAGVMIEGTVKYHMSNPIDLLATTIMVGRLIEISEGLMIPTTIITRPNVIKALTGKWPGRNHKISKADMQEIVRKILGLDNVVRSQHCSDAVAAVLAIISPVPQILPTKTIKKKKKNKK